MRKKLLLLFLCVFIFTVTKGSVTRKSILQNFLIEAEKDGMINSAQLENLLQRAEEEDEKVMNTVVYTGENEPSRPGVFIRMYNHLTLLNILYFSGALLIMGAYSLLMTLAWEHCNGTGITSVMVAQTVVFGIVGIILWDTDYQFLGGLLCSVSVGMVPYTVYCIQRALDIWPQGDPGIFQGFNIYVRPGWVAMEISTVFLGFIYLFLVRFPFLLAPISFSLWYLSMDIAPLFPTWSSSSSFEIRRRISIVFGLGLLVAGRLFEWALGSDPDFGFWLYLFGLIAFWFSLILHPSSVDPLAISVFFLINLCLVLIGSHLNRVTFHLFGSVGVIIMMNIALIKKGHIKTTFVLWMLKALAAVSLLANSIKTTGNIEILNAIVCFIAFNAEAFLYIPKGELYSWLLLLTNLGFVAVVPSFDRPLNIWFFEVNSAQPIISLTSLAVGLYHLPLLKYYANRHHLTPKNVSFLGYRVIVSILISFILLFLQQYWFAWIGVLGIPIIAMLPQPRMYSDPVKRMSSSLQFLLLLFSIAFSIYLESNLFYLVSCLCMGATLTVFIDHRRGEGIFGCTLSVILILVSVPLQSKFLIAIGGIYIFLYLGHLAYEVFKRSIIFPLVLVGLGISLIYIGVMYQWYQESLYKASTIIFPTQLYNELQAIIREVNWYPHFKNATFSFQNMQMYPFIWALWPGAMVHALVQEPVPYASYGCGFGIVFILLAMLYLKVVDKYCPDLKEVVQVHHLRISLNPYQGNGNGLVIALSGTKPSDLDQPKYISLNIYGEQFWNDMSSQFTGFAANIMRSAFLPYQLTPSLITTQGFKTGSTKFSATIELGTGKAGKPSISRETIITNARKVATKHSTMTCVLLYSNAIYLPYMPLCSYETFVDSACEMILDNK